MRIGQEGDTRKFRRLKKTDYYEAKAAVDAGEVTRWPTCECCGSSIIGQVYDGKYCFRCKNEPL